MNKLCFVIPCFNEEEVLAVTITKLLQKMDSLEAKGMVSPESRITLVDDGSTDGTWSVIREYHQKHERIEGIKLSRNRGHQYALLAGLLTVKDNFDVVVTMDADLQDDIEAVDKMLEAYVQGAEIVYGVRSRRQSDTFFKRFTAESFYKLMHLMGVELVFNHADFRLLSQRALNCLAEYKEANLFLRGIIPLIGFKTDIVEYERHERFAGETKYPLKKMLNFAADGITSFSIKPLRFIFVLGLVIFILSIIMSVYFFLLHYQGKTVPGWTTIVMTVWAIGVLQLLSIGVVGEYVGKLYLEAKQRPRYFIEAYLRRDN